MGNDLVELRYISDGDKTGGKCKPQSRFRSRDPAPRPTDGFDVVRRARRIRGLLPSKTTTGRPGAHMRQQRAPAYVQWYSLRHKLHARIQLLVAARPVYFFVRKDSHQRINNEVFSYAF
uniref:Uncharacterized protein n=1 Tax=Setaria viridis TaxID=4556 RepID=A0A4U6VPV9_SETVI|nr:hypothetical protein SEVIR_2G072600v2 [Setaria viridis]